MTRSSTSVPEPVHEAHAIPTSESRLVDEVQVDLTETEQFILETLERLDAADTEAAHLRRALDHSRDIGAAVGVLMALRKVTREEAFELLRRASQDQNRKLHQLALDVVITGELPCRAG
jgi:AmiR/NasT family two-component response regulator